MRILIFPGQEHQHQPIEGKIKHQGDWVNRSELAGVYPPKFCTALAYLYKHALVGTRENARFRRAARARGLF